MNLITKPYNNSKDGHSYYLRFNNCNMLEIELWACPTQADNTPDFGNELLVSEFNEPLTNLELSRILDGITDANLYQEKDGAK